MSYHRHMSEKIIKPGECAYLLPGMVAVDPAHTFRIVAASRFPSGATLRVETSPDGVLRIEAKGFPVGGGGAAPKIAHVERFGSGGTGFIL